jgi:hypothetical protein
VWPAIRASAGQARIVTKISHKETKFLIWNSWHDTCMKNNCLRRNISRHATEAQMKFIIAVLRPARSKLSGNPAGRVARRDEPRRWLQRIEDLDSRLRSASAKPRLVKSAARQSKFLGS